MRDACCFAVCVYLAVCFQVVCSIDSQKQYLNEENVHPIITGMSVEEDEGGFHDGINVVYAQEHGVIRLFGKNLDNKTLVAFTTDAAEALTDCNNMGRTDPYKLHIESDAVATVHANFAAPTSRYYMCVKSMQNDHGTWLHQGDAPWLVLEVRGRLMPLAAQIVLICVLLCLSGLFAGLNLGLMSLDKNELRVIATSGTESEKIHARAIEPIRRRGNYLLCTILISNVMINSTLTVFLDQLTTGIIAVITSTLSIVIFGDIIPQAICSRHGLAVGAKTIYITYLFMLLTFPLSYPVSKILDLLLGDEIGQVYDRQKLMEFIRVTKDHSKLENDEVNMISGALNLKTKTAGEVMTRLEDVFMLHTQSLLDFETVSLIQKRGYSRIPVYDDDRKNIVALFHAKDLAFVDPNDKMPIRTLIEFYKHPLIYTNEETTLDQVLEVFKEGRSHLAFVRQHYDSADEDPYFEVTGVVSLEDVIEEILQTEIVDETDILSDNRRKQRIKKTSLRQDFSEFAKIGEGAGNSIVSPQMALAAFQFLSSSVEPFSPQFVTDAVLRRLMSQKIYFAHRVEEEEDGHVTQAQILALYTATEPADYFVMILEGRVRVTVGKEKLIFVSGPFTHFGVEALRVTVDGAASEFVPDYSVDVIESVVFIKVPRSVYLYALKASLMEKENGPLNGTINDRLAIERADVESGFGSTVTSLGDDSTRTVVNGTNGHAVVVERAQVIAMPDEFELTRRNT